ncbi:D-glycero-beta-D-manno-heptose 1,7-bisphosphate 7-phosphatase [Ferrimonas lipolytica]|uniref:D,D-heptose 1,7-bisphosphate phosphatase n=1 Tax=Ferrimonas lipolytica TaxID=2724191 RepID=A0A6H1UDD1_9GAMM|nr:D-glycero-beta-D-manno-heptose 1,7-bisphosphate 7-phosphatase [Ferrimonas lipolytica]QIZ76848.1 D-glycero-beta-D-manno-heptose 1,7-bisphosphate 7-phosphatase [Ferrimonas lipolytica]
MNQSAVFLDRDGVINVDHGYVHDVESFEFIPGTLEACVKLHRAGYALIVVTNQSGIARGYYDEQQFLQLSQWMREQFQQAGAPLTDVYYCPHHPDKGNAPYIGKCECRKPEPGMLLRAAKEHNIDLSDSIMIGDKYGDMLAGKLAEVRQCVLVRSGKSVDGKGEVLADSVEDNLAAAAEWVLNQ